MSVRAWLPELSIRKRADSAVSESILLRDVDICLDGVPVKGLQSFRLYMALDDVNRVYLSLDVRDVHIDDGFLAALNASARVKEEAPL